MVRVNYYDNGTLVEPPFNQDELEIELNFDRDKTNVRQRVTANNIEWVRENNDNILQHITDGETNGVGIFEGRPLGIELDRNGTIEKVFDGYQDLAEEGRYGETRSEVKIKERNSIDWLNDIADGFDFEYLAKNTVAGAINSGDYISIPYILNSVPDYLQSAVAGLTSVFVLQQLKEAIKELSKLAAQLANPLEATAIVQTVIEVVYIIALFVSLIQLIKDMILFLIQPVKYHSGMRVKTLLEKGSTFLNTTFKSPSVFDVSPWDDLVIIPEKNAVPDNPGDDRIFNFTNPTPAQQAGYYKGTFGDLIRDMKTMFHAKIEVRQNNSTGNIELWFLKDDENASLPQYQLPDFFNDKWKYNTGDFRANFVVKFATDVTDKNTIQQYLGTYYGAQLRPVTVINPDLVLMKNSERVEIPFALAKRKTKLTVPEKICNAFLQVFNALVNGVISALNAVINVINQITGLINSILNALDFIGINISFQIPSIPSIPGVNLSNLITNRIGMLQIENDNFTKPKLVLLDVAANPKNTKVKSTNATDLSAKNIFNLFHIGRMFVPSAGKPTGNQYKIKDYSDIHFTFSDYLKVKDSNIIFDAQGNKAEVSSLRWKPKKQKANLTVRFPYLYTNNLQLITVEPDGS